ncbi:MAG: hypothetical protein P1U38_15875 [Aeromicrobium sp.]|uniref:hypothetical protein n=1 Tax=Aeromicrobium sp. TaxID=1871063 RepID=UPI002622CAF5|nr:hypothetical protein [Aeromicrobium sp.]MDF1706247.1 hypothetical protein [Aeromicrobium sp.]
MLLWSVIALVLGVGATTWAFATDRDVGAWQLGALVGGSTLAFGGVIGTVVGVVPLL